MAGQEPLKDSRRFFLPWIPEVTLAAPLASKVNTPTAFSPTRILTYKPSWYLKCITSVSFSNLHVGLLQNRQCRVNGRPRDLDPCKAQESLSGTHWHPRYPIQVDITISSITTDR